MMETLRRLRLERDAKATLRAAQEEPERIPSQSLPEPPKGIVQELGGFFRSVAEPFANAGKPSPLAGADAISGLFRTTPAAGRSLDTLTAPARNVLGGTIAETVRPSPDRKERVQSNIVRGLSPLQASLSTLRERGEGLTGPAGIAKDVLLDPANLVPLGVAGSAFSKARRVAGLTRAPQTALQAGRLTAPLSTMEDTVRVATTPDALRNLAQKTQGLPVLNKVVRRINPAGAANRPEDLYLVGRAQMRFEAEQKVTGAVARLDSLGMPDKFFGKLGPNEQITTGPLSGQFLADVASDPSRYWSRLNPAQRQWVQEIGRVNAEIRKVLLDGGIRVPRNLNAGPRYVGRRVVGKIDPKTGEMLDVGYVGSTGKNPQNLILLETRKTFENDRVFKTIQDATAAGFRYLSTSETAYLNLRDAFYRVADRRAARWLQDRLIAEGATLASAPKATATQIPGRFLHGVFVEGQRGREVAQTLSRYFDSNVGSALETAQKASDVGRYMVLQGDASPMFIQLLFAPFRHPAVYAKSAASAGRALFDGAYLSKYRAANNAVIQNSPNLILSRGGLEFTEAIARGGFLNALTRNKVTGFPFRASQRFYEAIMDVAGIEMKKALMPLAKSPDDIRQLDDYINHFRGLTDSTRLGLNSGERVAESIALLAPRYFRANVALLSDLANGGIRGQVARRSMLQAAFGLSATAIGVSVAAGETLEEALEHLDPRSSKFFTWRIGDTNVGPGTKMRSFLRLIGRTSDSAFDEPDNFLQAVFAEPALGFIRANLGPVPSLITDLVTGRNFIGDPVDVTDIRSIRDNILYERLLFVWVQAFIEDGTPSEKAFRGGVEFFGARGYPVSPRQEFEDYVAEREGAPFNALDRDVITQYQRADSRGRELWQEHLRDQEERGRRDQAFSLIQASRDLRDKRMNETVLSLQRGEISYPDLAAAFDALQKEYGSRIEFIIQQNQETFDKMEERSALLRPFDDLFREYQNTVLFNPAFTRDDGSFDYRARDAAQEAFRLKVGDDLFERIDQAAKATRLTMPPEAQEYLALSDQYEWYDRMEDVYDASRLPAGTQMAWNEYITTRSGARRSQLRDENDAVKRILSAIRRAKEIARQNDPMLDAYLVKWRGRAPRTLLGEQVEREMRALFRVA